MTNRSQSLLEELLDGYQEEAATEALEMFRQAAEQLSPAEITVNLPADLTVCLDAGMALQTMVEEDKEQLLKLPGISEKTIDALGSLRLALWQASVARYITLSTSRKQSLTEVVGALRTVRKQLLGAIDYIWPTDETIQRQGAQIRRGAGYVDLANDGQALFHLFEEHLDAAKVWLQPDKLAQMLSDLQKLAPLLLSLRTETEDTNEQQAEDLLKRVYSLYEKTYNQLARGGRYLFDGTDPGRTTQYANLYSIYLRTVRQPTPPSQEPPSVPTPEAPTSG